MKIQCQKCSATYSVDESRIPEKGARVTCKKCGNKIHIPGVSPVESQEVSQESFNEETFIDPYIKGKNEDAIFNLPSLTSCLKTLKTWTKRAGITKNITWHSARHSFATILLMNNSDVRTVSALLGHSSIDHTQKYLHIVNELKKKAVNKLPEIEI